MGEGFANAVVGGAKKLIREAIESTLFVAGVSGWRIAKNGSAEFNSITIRGGTSTQGVILMYTGTPALGNLFASLAQAAGNDSFGNAYKRGLAIYDPATAGRYLNADLIAGLATLLLNPDSSLYSNGNLNAQAIAVDSGRPLAVLSSPYAIGGTPALINMYGQSVGGAFGPLVSVQADLEVSGIGQVQTVEISGSAVTITSTALQDVTGIVLPVVSGGTYLINITGARILNAATVAGFGFSGPSTSRYRGFLKGMVAAGPTNAPSFNADTVLTNAIVFNTDTASGSGKTFELTGYVTFSASGNLQFRAQRSGATDMTVLTGTRMTLTRVA